MRTNQLHYTKRHVVFVSSLHRSTKFEAREKRLHNAQDSQSSSTSFRQLSAIFLQDPIQSIPLDTVLERKALGQLL